MATFQERYTPSNLAINEVRTIYSDQVGGFLCKTSGAISINKIYGGALIVDTIPVTAGVYTPIPFFIGVTGFIVTLTGGASGTLGS